MQRRLVEILACPIDKYHPLSLLEFETTRDIIVTGALICNKCKRFYPIIDEIPVMLPDDLRKRDEDEAFLKKWKDKMPGDVQSHGSDNPTP